LDKKNFLGALGSDSEKHPGGGPKMGLPPSVLPFRKLDAKAKLLPKFQGPRSDPPTAGIENAVRKILIKVFKITSEQDFEAEVNIQVLPHFVASARYGFGVVRWARGVGPRWSYPVRTIQRGSEKNFELKRTTLP